MKESGLKFQREKRHDVHHPSACCPKHGQSLPAPQGARVSEEPEPWGVAAKDGRRGMRPSSGRGSAGMEPGPGGAGAAEHCACAECYRVIHFKMANFMSCKFHLNTLFCKKF